MRNLQIFRLESRFDKDTTRLRAVTYLFFRIDLFNVFRIEVDKLIGYRSKFRVKIALIVFFKALAVRLR